MESELSDGLTGHRALFYLSLALCIAGVAIGIALSMPEIGQWGGVMSVGLSFFLLFLSRDTAKRSLKRPLVRAHAQAAEPEAELSRALVAFGASPVMTQEDLRAAAVALLQMKDEEMSAIREGNEARANACASAMTAALITLPDDRRIALDATFRAEHAYRLAENNRAALAAHLDWVRKETVPLAAISIGGTLVAGFGDVLVSLALP